MSGYYQPAPAGVWRSTPEHILLWAVEGVLQRIRRDMPEQKEIASWQAKLDAALVKPVRAFDWSSVYAAKLAKAKGDDEDVRVPREIMDDWEETIGALIAELHQAAATVRTKAEDLPLDQEALDEAMRSTSKLVAGISDTARDRLRTLIRQAYDEKTSQTGFAKLIRGEFATFSKQRAELIAVTEWNRAASQATLIGYKKQGVQMKRWYTAGDNRVCPVCDDNAAQFAIPIDDEFPSGDDAPPAHPGCRCNLAPG